MKDNTKLTVILCLYIFFAVINNTMFNVAIPFIQSSYDLSSGQVSLVSVIYLAIFSVGTMVYGKLADFFPIKTLYILGAGLLIGGSVIGFFSTSYEVLLLGRIVQAAGGSAIPSLTMLAFNAFYSQEKRAAGMTLLASMASLGAGGGPVLGGLITSFFGYKGLFLVTASIVVLLPFLVKLMPMSVSKKGSFDFKGCILLVGAILLFVVGLSTDSRLCLAGIFFFVLFVYDIAKAKVPFINIALLKNKLFTTVLFIGFIAFMVSIANLFLLPMMLKQLNGMSAFAIGLSLLPGSVISFLSGNPVKRCYDKVGAIKTMQGILLLLGIAFFSISTFSGQSYIVLAALSVFSYIGFAAIQVVIGNYMFVLLPREEVNTGMGIYNLVSFVGGAVGPALSGKYLDLKLLPFLNIWNHGNVFADAFMLLAIASAGGMVFLTVVSSYHAFPEKQTAGTMAEGEKSFS